MSNTSTHQSSATCRACGNQSLTTLSRRSERVCTTCGFVADTDTSVPSAPFRDGAGGGDTPASWGEHYTVHNSTEQQVATAFEQLEAVSDQLHLSVDACEASAEKYAAAQIAGITDGRSTAAMIAAAICVGTRSIQQPLPANRVAEASDCDPSRVKQYARLYQAKLDQELSVCDLAAYIAWLCTDGQFAGVAEVHLCGELGRFLVSEAGVSEECDDRFVPSPKVLRASVGGGVPHRVYLLRGKPDSGLLVLSFRIR